MPKKPVNVITVKGKITDVFDKFMIVSYHDETIVLTIGEQTVSQVKDSGLVDNERTLHVGILEDNSYV